MLPSWERIVYFHLIPSIMDGLIALAGVLLLLRVFRVRDPSIRALFLFIPLLRPLIIFLEGGARLEQHALPSVAVAIRVPDPLNLIPIHIADLQQPTHVSQIIAFLIIALLLIALAVLSVRWAGLLVFYKRLRKSSEGRPVDPRLSALIKGLSAEMGLKRPPRILISQESWATPCAIGWRHPALVINPRIMQEFDAGELRAIMAHELGHIKRGDGFWHWVSLLLRDVQSFNPFSHMSLSRIRLEREKACDRVAIEEARVSPGLLAECLVKAAKLSVAGEVKPLPGYGMSFIKDEFGLMQTRLDFLISMPKGQPVPRPAGGAASAGRLRMAVLLLLMVPLTVLQLYIGIWVSSFPLVIK